MSPTRRRPPLIVVMVVLTLCGYVLIGQFKGQAWSRNDLYMAGLLILALIVLWQAERVASWLKGLTALRWGNKAVEPDNRRDDER